MKLFRTTSSPRNDELAILARSLELSPTRRMGDRISGRRGNAFVELETREDGVLISAGPIQPLPPGLRISKGPGEGITLDDAELQQLVHVRAANPAAAIRLLRIELVRNALLKALATSAAFDVSGGWISALVTSRSTEDLRASCSSVLKLLGALTDAAIELSLHAAEEREAAKDLPVPEGGKRFIAVQPLDEVENDRLEDLRREARARVVWGARRKEILKELKQRGASETVAVQIYEEAWAAHDAGRRAALAVRSAVATGAMGLGVLLERIPNPAGIHMHSGLAPFTVPAFMVIGLGVYQLGLGVARYVRAGRQ
ncbi:MAG: hypothetical protein ACJ790_03210 [Myxococcaceae bacterium]